MRPVKAPQVLLGLRHHWSVVASFSLSETLGTLFPLHDGAVEALSFVVPDLSTRSREMLRLGKVILILRFYSINNYELFDVTI